jgi:predicted RNase H-like nuclease (RuvC/YqgF family)
MDGLDWGALVLAGAGVLTGIGLWIRARAHIAESTADAAACRDEWERATIDKQRQEVADLVAQRESVLNGHIATLTDTLQKQRARLDYFETEVTNLRAERTRDQEQILKLTERVHTLELENERLKAQRDAREEQVELLKQELAVLRGQSGALFQLVSEVGALVRVATGMRPAGEDVEPLEQAA